MARNSSGNRGDVRQSALWGSGNRGGELRSNALWGKGGRGRGIAVLMLLALAMPLAAAAGDGKSTRYSPDRKIDRLELNAYLQAMAAKSKGLDGLSETAAGTRVDTALLQKAEEQPNAKVRVIIQARAGVDSAGKAGRGLGTLTNKLGLIGAVSMEMQAKQIEKLADMPGLIVTVDEPIRPHGDYSSKHLWPYEAGMNKLWDGPQAPTIAIVDSGIDTSRLDFENRVLEQVEPRQLR